MPALLFRSHNVPKSTKILIGCLCITSTIILIIRLIYYREQLINNISKEEQNDTVILPFKQIQVPFLQLIPRSIIFYPWVILISIFSEISIISFLFSFSILYISTKYIDKFWGSKEVIKFILLIGSLTNFSTVLITISYNIFRGDVNGMDKPLGGGISYYFGFLVVIKQLIPEHNIVLFQGLINFRVKHLPFILINVVIVWSIFISKSLYPAIPSISSFIISYNYLRFYQVFKSDPILPITTASGTSDQDHSSILKGDASDTFQLVEFFPSLSKPYLTPVFNQCYELGSFLGIITPFNDNSIEQSNLRAQKRFEHVNQTQKSVANSVAERRRQVALQVIEDRINKETRV